MKLYGRYAGEIADLIHTQVLLPGDQLPSVRQARAQSKISAATVFHSRCVARGSGLFHCRPRSGFYVNPQDRKRAPQPETATPTARSSEAKISDLVLEILGSTRNLNLTHLCWAFPSPQLFPLDKLTKEPTPAMKRLPTEKLALSLYLQTGGLDRHLRNMRLSLEKNASLALRCITKTFPKGTKVTTERLFFVG